MRFNAFGIYVYIRPKTIYTYLYIPEGVNVFPKGQYISEGITARRVRNPEGIIYPRKGMQI